MVATLFGEKWLEMAPLVSGLALAMPCFALQILCSPATNALGKPKIYVRSSISGAIIMPIAFSIGLGWGVQGLVHAWQVAAPLLLIVTLALTLPEIGADWRKLAAALIPSLIASGVMASMVYIASRFTGDLPAPTELAILVAFGALCYLGLLWTFSRQTLEQIMDLVFRRKIAVA
jgi:O-antigen/teichoic acid export membrane protein